MLKQDKFSLPSTRPEPVQLNVVGEKKKNQVNQFHFKFMIMNLEWALNAAQQTHVFLTHSLAHCLSALFCIFSLLQPPRTLFPSSLSTGKQKQSEKTFRKLPPPLVDSHPHLCPGTQPSPVSKDDLPKLRATASPLVHSSVFL